MLSPVPFLNLHTSYLELKADIDSAIDRVLDSGCYILGSEVEAFEEAYAAYCGAVHCVGVGNGLDALILALQALGIGQGDEVLIPSNTYIATWLAVSAVGATPVPVEPTKDGHNIDPELLEEAISPNCRAIIAVHLYGQPANLDPILNVARQHNLYLVEDAAQAHGAKYKNSRIGSHGDVVCWSFYPGKNLGGFGDGGAITTNQEDVAKKVRILGNYGSSKKYINNVRGANSRLDPIQAAVLKIKLAHLDKWNEHRCHLAERYNSCLKGVITPVVPEWAQPVWHLYVIQHKSRDILASKLSKEGIQTLIHYPIPPHLQDAYSDLGLGVGSFPMAERLANTVLSLPIYPQMPSNDQDQVIEMVNYLSSTI